MFDLNQMEENTSKILNERLSSPKFWTTEEEHIKFKEAELPGSFSVSLVIGQLNFDIFGLIDKNQPESPIVDLKFCFPEANEKLAFIDIVIGFCLNKHEQSLSLLSFREIESFLRNENHMPALPNNGAAFVPYFEKIKEALTNSIIESRGYRTEGPLSPTISEDYRPGEKTIINEMDQGEFLDLTIQKQNEALNRVFAKFIRPFLHRDRGDIECLFIDGTMIVVNYLGTCAHCTKSLTTTMDYIQKVLRLELNQPDLVVITDS